MLIFLVCSCFAPFLSCHRDMSGSFAGDDVPGVEAVSLHPSGAGFSHAGAVPPVPLWCGSLLSPFLPAGDRWLLSSPGAQAELSIQHLQFLHLHQVPQQIW